jgi:alkaline phosphatase
VASRNNYGDIDVQLAETDYEFFGGGGLKVINAEKLAGYGYTVLYERESILALKDAPKDKVICINPWLQDSSAMPYAIDRLDTNLSLAEMIEMAIDEAIHGMRATKSTGPVMPTMPWPPSAICSISATPSASR